MGTFHVPDRPGMRGRKPNTHREGRHGIQRIAVNLGRDECQYEVGHAAKEMRTCESTCSRVYQECARNLRTDVESP